VRAKLPVKESTSDLNEIPLRITLQNDLLTPDTLGLVRASAGTPQKCT